MSITVLDALQRANENPLSDGGKWTGGVTTATALKLVSNQAVRQGANGVFGRDGGYRNDVLFPAGANCQVGCTVATVGADGALNLHLWDPVGAQGYTFFCDQGSFGSGFSLQIAPGGLVLDANPRVAAAAGDVLDLQIVGDDIVGLRYSLATGWRELCRVTDATVRAAFRPGIEIAGFNDGASNAISNFGGNLLPASPSALAVPRVASVFP